MTFLDDFINRLHLTKDDAAELRRKRGFSNETIERLRFKSLGPYVDEIVRSLNPEAARAALLLDDSGKVNFQLTKPNILIPYMNADGSVFKVRPHKFGLPDDPIKIYAPFLLKDFAGGTLIITEGEFKAAAAWQMGLPCVAVPGVSAYVKNNLPELLAFLADSQFANVVIVFDREVKDNPALPSYKPEPSKRHDTAIYAYILAKSISEADTPIRCLIGELPAEWMVGGKIDIDGALAQGKTAHDMSFVIAEAMGHEAYLDHYTGRIGKDQGPLVRRKIHRFYQNQFSNVRRHFSRYQIRRKDDWVDVSNFVFDVVGKFYDAELEHEVRQVVLQSDTMQKIGPVPVQPTMLTNKQAFAKFTTGKGDLVFKGTENDLLDVVLYEFNRTLIETKMTQVRHCGKIDRNVVGGADVWAFRDVALCDGKVINRDQDGVFWLPSGMGLMVRAADGIPVPNVTEEAIDFPLLGKMFFDLAGRNGQILLGWAVYTLLDDYIQADDISPFPFFFGERGSGKTSVCKCIMGLFGLFDFGSQITDITNAAIQRVMAFYSGIPFWLDEFHNTKSVEGKEPFLKSVYNKIPVLRGTKEADNIKTYKIRSKLILSGETIAKTDGVKSRSVMMESRIQGPQGKRALSWFKENRDRLGAFTMQILKRKDELAPKIKKRIFEIQDEIGERFPKCDERMMRHLSFFMASFEVVFGFDKVFHDWIFDFYFQSVADITTMDEVEQMFESLASLHAQRKIDDSYVKVYDEEILFWFSGFYDVWSKEFAGRVEIHDKRVLLKNIQKRPYFLKTELRRISGSPRRCLVFRYADAPQSLKDFAEIMGEKDALRTTEVENDIPF